MCPRPSAAPAARPAISDVERLERVAATRAAALEALTRASGTDSLCTLSRERLPAAKYHEGAVAALGDVLRAARRGDPDPDPTTWGAAFAARADADTAWRAYLVGGRDALTALSTTSSIPAPGTAAVAPEAAPRLAPAAATG